MASKPVLLTAVLALALLAGCADDAPKGTLTGTGSGLAVDGSIVIEYTPFDSGGNPASQLPMGAGEPVQCAQDNSPQEPPAGVSYCTDASSSFHAHFMALPTPDSNGYHVVLVGPAGELDLGAISANEANMWDLANNQTSDLTGQYDTVQLRMGTFVLATASAAEGTNAFALAEGLAGVSVTGTFNAKTLNVTVAGLPEGGAYMGRLYTLDDESGLLTPGDFFPVSATGSTEYKDKELNIGDYAEFHVHVGTSSVNLLKVQIP